MNVKKLKAFMALNEITINELAKQMQISKSAIFRKLNGTSEFNQGEIAYMARILKLTPQDIYDIFFDK